MCYYIGRSIPADGPRVPAGTMARNLYDRFSRLGLDLRLFFGAVAIIGFSQSMMESVFNNYLNDTFGLTSVQRTFLELPRELPGFLVIFVSAVLFFMCTRRLALFSTLLAAVGLILITFLAPTYHAMLAWLFIYSLGVHLFIPIQSSITMELAHEGATGRRLGQVSGVRTFAGIIGSFAVFAGFRYLGMTFAAAFLIGAAGFAAAARVLSLMKTGKTHPPHVHLRLYPRYKLYYWLSVLFGTRKQVFLTFAPWVLVTVFNQPTQVVAILMTIAGVAGIAFQPIIGRAIDRFGERAMLAAEGFILVFICLGYGFAKALFSLHAAFLVTATCFILDLLMFAFGMARATYLKKIAGHPDHVAPTLAMGTSIDHFFSISIALIGGVIWQTWGYQYVFLCGAGIALTSGLSALGIRTGQRAEG